MEHEGIEEFVENEFLFTNQIFMGKNSSKTSLSSEKRQMLTKWGVASEIGKNPGKAHIFSNKLVVNSTKAFHLQMLPHKIPRSVSINERKRTHIILENLKHKQVKPQYWLNHY